KKRELRTDIDNDKENSDVLEIIDLIITISMREDVQQHIVITISMREDVQQHIDSSKHRDTPSMERFNCDGILKIAIEREANKSELGQNRYRRQDDAFNSAIQWLKENNYTIILEETYPVRALAIVSEITDYLLQKKI
ncbi:25141_t:CDS:2, partial [Gigaspora margarita]